MKREDFIRSVELGIKVFTLAWTIAESWELAKMLHPVLQDREDLVVAAVRRQFTRSAETELPELSNADRAMIYNMTRGPGL